MHQSEGDAVDDLLLAPQAILGAKLWAKACGVFVIFPMGAILEAQWDSASEPSSLLVRETILAVGRRSVEREAQCFLETEPQYRRFWILHNSDG